MANACAGLEDLRYTDATEQKCSDIVPVLALEKSSEEDMIASKYADAVSGEIKSLYVTCV